MLALITFLSAFGVSYVTTAALLRAPLAKRILDIPNERSSHEVPKPRTGGIAIAAGITVGAVVLGIGAPETRQFAPLVLGAVVLFTAGLIDDWRGLGVGARMAAQLFAAIAVVASGAVIEQFYFPAVGMIGLGWLAMPVTVLFILTSINFYNFIDGIDGLAAGSAFIAAGFLSLISLMLGHGAIGLVYLAVAGAAIGFLQFNFPPARLFMGDSGSTVLGFFFAYMAIVGNAAANPMTIFIPVLILSSLYADAGLTLLGRLMRRENVFKAHHTHYYQRLLSLGLNHKQITLLEYGIVVLLGISALLYYTAGEFFGAFLAGVWALVFMSLILKIRSLERGDRLFWERRTLFVVGADLVAIVLAFVGAYALRMNFNFEADEARAMLKMMPVVVVIRSACFYAYGLYRGVWKYTSTADVVRVVKAVTVGSAATVTAAVLLFRFIALPRSLFVFEFVLLILLVLGTRFAVRFFHEIGREANETTARRVGVVGAGDAGEHASREFRSAIVACFVDDDPDKIGLVLQGAPIEGPIDTLPDIVKRHSLDALAIAIPRLTPQKLTAILALASEAGVEVIGRTDAMQPAQRAVIQLDRVTHSLAFQRRPLRQGLAERLRDRTVLVTGPLPEAGIPLLRCLCEVARVSVVGDPRAVSLWPSVEFDGKVNVFAGTAPEDIGHAIETIAPEIIIHPLSLDIVPSQNHEGHVWQSVVRSTEVLCKAVATTRLDRLVVVSSWGAMSPGSFIGRAAIVAETMVLNHAATRSGARVIRLPRVYGETAAAAVALASSDYDTHAAEAVAAVLASASKDSPGIWALKSEFAFRLDGVQGAVVRSASEPAGLTYPGEVTQDDDGDLLVRSPITSVVGPLERVVSGDFADIVAGDRDEWLRLVTASLYQVGPAWGVKAIR